MNSATVQNNGFNCEGHINGWSLSEAYDQNNQPEGATDPFVDSEYLLDYRLVEGSTFVNAGNNSFVADLQETTDFFGKARVSGNVVDIGAIEYDANRLEILSLTPNQVVQGVPTEIAVAGRGFAEGSTVSFNGHYVTASSPEVADTNNLTLVVTADVTLFRMDFTTSRSLETAMFPFLRGALRVIEQPLNDSIEPSSPNKTQAASP